MKSTNFALLVAIAPAVACAAVGFVVEVVPMMKEGLKKLSTSAEKVAWVKEIVSHASFYGFAAAGFLGYTKDSPITSVLAVVWFIFCLRVSYALACHLEELEETKAALEKKARHRQLGGTVRAIVRDEILRATPTTKGGAGIEKSRQSS